MKSVVSEKGQVTIPKPIRERLGLVRDSVIDFRTEGGRLIGEKGDSIEDPVLAVTGIVKKRVRVDRYLEETRGPVR